MSVAHRNPFALLDAEDGSRPASPAPVKQQAQPTPSAQREANKPKGGPRGGKYYPRGGPRGGSAGRDSGNPNQNGVEDAPDTRKSSRGDGGRGRGSGRGRGGRGTGSGRGRQFDKHSQTGKVDTDKRIHQSWGGDDGETELKVTTEATLDVVAETSVDNSGWGAPTNDGWDAPSGEPVAATGAEDSTAAAGADSGDRRPRRDRDQEEDDNTLTLDQYLAQQKEKEEALVPKLEETRKANDGQETWKDVTPLQKNEEEYFVGKKQGGAQKSRAKKEDKVYIEIDARFDRPARGGRGGRGGDRGGRGGRGRGGRGGSSYGQGYNPQGPDVDDQTAFPSLS